jgi:hypothetical protein
VTAESLYEAVGKALILRQGELVEEIGEGLTEVQARVTQSAVEYFPQRLESQGRRPAEQALKRRLAEPARGGGSQRRFASARQQLPNRHKIVVGGFTF